jgi:hypothetical protein
VAGGIMKILTRLIVISSLLLIANLAQGEGLDKSNFIKESLMSNSLSMAGYSTNKFALYQKGDDLRGNIYEFHTKSPAKAFVYSLIIPGSGQLYIGSKIKATTFLAADILLWSGYFLYHSKGVNKEKGYKAYADQHYISSVFRDWWATLDSSTTNRFSHRLYFDSGGNPVRNREYYENLGKYDEFQVGWDDIGLNHPPPGVPGGDSTGMVSPHRGTYLSMRKKANDYFASAKTMFTISIANHIISAFEAAIGARKYNRGTKQYSINLEPRNIDGNLAPFVVLETKF